MRAYSYIQEVFYFKNYLKHSIMFLCVKKKNINQKINHCNSDIVPKIIIKNI